MQRNDARGLLTRLHREQARRVAHPSPRQLDDYERTLTTREDAVEYVEYVAWQAATRYPSPAVMARLELMVRRIERHDALARLDALPRMPAADDDAEK